MQLIVDAFLGAVLGLTYAWGYAARESHRRLKRFDPVAPLPLTLVASRIFSIGLIVGALTASGIIVVTHKPSLLDLMVYIFCTLSVAMGVWKLILKPKIVPPGFH